MPAPIASTRLGALPLRSSGIRGTPVPETSAGGAAAEHSPSLHRNGLGVEFFCELYRLRTEDIQGEDLITRAQLERLARYSGGRARDFVKSVRMLAARAARPRSLPATDEQLEHVLTEARKLLETGLTRTHIELLQSIAEDPEHRLVKLDEETRVLLPGGQLLPYDNGSEWFFPHPLLTLSVVSVSTPSPQA